MKTNEDDLFFISIDFTYRDISSLCLKSCCTELNDFENLEGDAFHYKSSLFSFNLAIFILYRRHREQ